MGRRGEEIEPRHVYRGSGRSPGLDEKVMLLRKGVEGRKAVKKGFTTQKRVVSLTEDKKRKKSFSPIGRFLGGVFEGKKSIYGGCEGAA